jgi:hypothetical protein
MQIQIMKQVPKKGFREATWKVINLAICSSNKLISAIQHPETALKASSNAGDSLCKLRSPLIEFSMRNNPDAYLPPV